MPPASLIGYYGRYCRQVWPFLAALMAIGLVVSLIEVAILRYVGAIVDILRTTPPGRGCFEAHGLPVPGHGAPDPHRPSDGELQPTTSSSSRRSRLA